MTTLRLRTSLCKLAEISCPPASQHCQSLRFGLALLAGSTLSRVAAFRRKCWIPLRHQRKAPHPPRNACRDRLSMSSIKRDVKKKVSPSTGRREDFCLEIQPTACECAPRFAREVPLWLVCISVAFIAAAFANCEKGPLETRMPAVQWFRSALLCQGPMQVFQECCLAGAEITKKTKRLTLIVCERLRVSTPRHASLHVCAGIGRAAQSGKALFISTCSHRR
jgi:hypothetical protein